MLLCGCGAETWLLLLLAVGGSLVTCFPCHQTLAHHGSSGAQLLTPVPPTDGNILLGAQDTLLLLWQRKHCDDLILLKTSYSIIG